MTAGNTIRAALDGTLSFSVPLGVSLNPFKTSSAASISLNNGASFSMRRSPGSVGATLRVVRLSKRRPSFASRRRTAMLRLEAETPLIRAASRKPPARATDTNAARSFNSMVTVHIFEQPVQFRPDYLTTQSPPYWRHIHQGERHVEFHPIKHLCACRSSGAAPGLRRHAAGRTRRVRGAKGSRRSDCRIARSGGVGRQSHRYERLLRTAHHQPDHSRSASPVSG
ncbi:Aldo-keto reductase [Caballeronia sordidicola]|uniref:Aldo-keto reductase n=1 Tax=Caballeronia sordidicola TaxID=196367 RepID=A0A226X4E0_CABSO|nr:Aldo-keto reductase [Caballeronia sordidicola]